MQSENKGSTELDRGNPLRKWVLSIVGNPHSFEKIHPNIDEILQKETNPRDRSIKRGIVACLYQTPGYTMQSNDLAALDWELWKHYDLGDLNRRFKEYIVNHTHELCSRYVREHNRSDWERTNKEGIINALSGLLKDQIFSNPQSLADYVRGEEMDKTRERMINAVSQIWAMSPKGWLKRDSEKVRYMLSVPFDDVMLQDLTGPSVWVAVNRKKYIQYVTRQYLADMVQDGILAKGGWAPHNVIYSIDPSYTGVVGKLLGSLKRLIQPAANYGTDAPAAK